MGVYRFLIIVDMVLLAIAGSWRRKPDSRVEVSDEPDF